MSVSGARGVSAPATPDKAMAGAMRTEYGASELTIDRTFIAGSVRHVLSDRNTEYGERRVLRFHSEDLVADRIDTSVLIWPCSLSMANARLW
jgi:hypothetical protein